MRLLFLIPLLTLQSILTAQVRDTITLQEGWKFFLGENVNASKIKFDDDNWKNVSIPHDWAIAGPFNPDGDGNTAKLPWKGEGWYRYDWTMPADWKDKRVYIIFDGVMAFPKVYVNEKLAGKWDYGYNSFKLDITDFLTKTGSNLIAVHADTRQHDSRWYPGAGIYRKVQMIALSPVHLDIWETFVTTPIIKPGYAIVQVNAEVTNKSNGDADIEIEQIVMSPRGIQIAFQVQKGKLIAGHSKEFESTFTLTDPQLWDVDEGILYTVKTLIRINGQQVDEQQIPFGIRSIRFTADDGFYLNNRRVQLKGVNLHHDHGPLGAAFYPRAMERQLQLLKEMGCNAVRTSHNTPAPELLDLCDRMGILVFNEIFDKYDRKADIVDTTDFDAFAHRNIKNFVTRDRNHPSIFIWSVGNEIGDVQWNKNGGFAKLRTMVNEVRRFDSTRPVTLVCDSRNSAALRHFDFYDVHSWNYGRRYDLARQLEPNKAVIISESASTVSTRGFYEWPLPAKKTDFTKSLQVSSYDLNAPEWAEVADDDFMWQEEEPYIAGEFVWTGFDYLGEPTPYDSWNIKKLGLEENQTSVSSYFGIFDLIGIPKDRYFLYQSVWGKHLDDELMYILPHWTWPGKEGDTIPVFVYTNGDRAELFVNGKSQGFRYKKPDSQNSIERYRLMWNDVVYEPGELLVKVYKEGEYVDATWRKTFDAPASIHLNPDRTTIAADGMDLSFVRIDIKDIHGNYNQLANVDIDLEVTGAGSIAGVGNGNPQSLDPFQSNRVKTFNGVAMLIVKSNKDGGPITVKANSPKLKGAEIKLMAIKPTK